MNGYDIVTWAKHRLEANVPYVWGGSSDAGYDCSGLTQAAYASVGVDIPRVAQDQYNFLTPVSESELKSGDLVFFSDTGSTNNVTHVGIYTFDGNFIHEASTTTGITTSNLNDSYYKTRFVGGGTSGNNTGQATNTTINSEGGVLNYAVGTVTDSAKSAALGIVGKIISFVAVLLVCVLAVALFMAAFNISV